MISLELCKYPTALLISNRQLLSSRGLWRSTVGLVCHQQSIILCEACLLAAMEKCLFALALVLTGGRFSFY